METSNCLGEGPQALATTYVLVGISRKTLHEIISNEKANWSLCKKNLVKKATIKNISVRKLVNPSL